LLCLQLVANGVDISSPTSLAAYLTAKPCCTMFEATIATILPFAPSNILTKEVSRMTSEIYFPMQVIKTMLQQVLLLKCSH
jgi:hypothetical protein